MTYPKSWGQPFRALAQRQRHEKALETIAQWESDRAEEQRRASIRDWMMRPIPAPIIPKEIWDIMTAAETDARKMTGIEDVSRDAMRHGIGVSRTQLDGYGRILFQRVDAVKDFIGPLPE